MISKHLSELRKSCRLHRGDVNLQTLLPVNKKGDYIFYGYRRCGIPDCVNPEHWTLNIRHGRSIDGGRAKPLFKRDPDITGEELHRIAKPLLRGTEPKTCQVKNCDAPHRATNLCARHSTAYTKWRKANGLPRQRQNFAQDLPGELPAPTKIITVKQRYCRAGNCDRPYQARGLCKLHYQRHQRLAGATW